MAAVFFFTVPILIDSNKRSTADLCRISIALKHVESSRGMRKKKRKWRRPTRNFLWIAGNLQNCFAKEPLLGFTGLEQMFGLRFRCVCCSLSLFVLIRTRPSLLKTVCVMCSPVLGSFFLFFFFFATVVESQKMKTVLKAYVGIT